MNKHRTRGQMYSVIVCAIAAAAVATWALSPVAEALAGALQQLGNALGTKP